ncbi:hypothetical protein BGW80DRAFT_1455646 [Lactifluus volemus]|nr:hypothetical protein BGW80DRAFT_1455646 [Lactifluus volemus]
MPPKRKRSSTHVVENKPKLEEIDPDDQPVSSRAHQTQCHATVRPPPFSNIKKSILREVGMRLCDGFALSAKDRDEIQAEGKSDAASGGLSFDATLQLLRFVYGNVHPTIEFGYHMLIDVILLRIASTVHGQAQKMDMIHNISVEATFETDSGMRLFSGVIDYLLARRASSESSLAGPSNAQTLDALTDTSVTLTIIRADDEMYQSALRAPLTVASYCKQQKLSVLRGCLTSGRVWLFFVYKALGDAPFKAEGEFYLSDPFELSPDIGNLPLILGLLADWANDATDCVQKSRRRMSVLTLNPLHKKQYDVGYDRDDDIQFGDV